MTRRDEVAALLAVMPGRGLVEATVPAGLLPDLDPVAGRYGYGLTVLAGEGGSGGNVQVRFVGLDGAA